MFERFTKDARQCVILAVEHARRRHDAQVTRSHLLLALADPVSPLAATLTAYHLSHGAIDEHLSTTRSGDPQAPHASATTDAEALAALGIDLDAIRRSVEQAFGEGALDRPVCRRDKIGFPGLNVLRGKGGGYQHIPFTDGAKKTLELSLREALRVKANEIRLEHIALGLLRDPGDEVAGLLTALDVDVAALRSDLEGPIRRTA